MLTACLAAPAWADTQVAAADLHAPSLRDRALALSPIDNGRPAVSLDVASSPAAPDTPLPPNATAAQQVDARAWVGRGRASLGVGLSAMSYRDAGFNRGDERIGLLNSAGAPLFGVGLRYQLSRDSRLTFDSMAAGRESDFATRVRVGMEFRSPPRQFMGITRGTFMRMQLSSASQVSLNYRGRKFAVTLNSDF